jgi:ABC-2 type transport system permease protein
VKYSLLVALREFGENVKTKGFWIGILLFPLLLAGGFQVPRLLEKYAKPTRSFCVVDPGGEFGKVIDDALEASYAKKQKAALDEWEAKKKSDANLAAFQPPKKSFRRIELPAGTQGASTEETIRNLRPWLKGDKQIEVDGKPDELFALVVLPPLELSIPHGTQFWCSNLADTGLSDLIEGALKVELRNREFLARGVDKKDFERINRIEVEFERKDPKKAEGEEQVSDAEQVRQWAPVGFVYMLFVAIMTVAQMLLSSTIEEKSNRIVEVLLSSVTPWELMLGKLLGVAFVGITMLVAWMGSLYGVLSFYAGGIGKGGEIAQILVSLVVSPGLLVPFVAYFLLGYLLYSSMLLAVGSTCNTLKDAQNFMGPVMTVLMVPLFTMMFIVQDPNGMLARVLSWVPIFTPFTMMNRMAGDPPTWEVVGTFVLLAGTVAFAIWFSGRIFQNGILRTGQPPKLIEFLKLARKG